jgi:hypothetical protein
MSLAILIIVCFLGTWLLAYLDHRAKFIQLFFDIPGLIFGMLLTFIILDLLYHVLKLIFEPS